MRHRAEGRGLRRFIATSVAGVCSCNMIFVGANSNKGCGVEEERKMRSWLPYSL